MRRHYYRFRIWFLDWQTELHKRLCSECTREREAQRELANRVELTRRLASQVGAQTRDQRPGMARPWASSELPCGLRELPQGSDLLTSGSTTERNCKITK